MHAFGEGFLATDPTKFGAQPVRKEARSAPRARTRTSYRVSANVTLAAFGLLVASTATSAAFTAPPLNEGGEETRAVVAVKKPDVHAASARVEIFEPAPLAPLTADLGEKAWREALALIAQQGEDPAELIAAAAVRADACRAGPASRNEPVELLDFDSEPDEV